MNIYAEQLGRIRQQIAVLTRQQTKSKLATVTAVDTAANTFTASIPGMSPLAGIPADPEHLPGIGTTARITLSGATPIFEPSTIRYIAPEKAVDGDMGATWVVSGGLLTALTGQRAGITPIGFQAWDASGALSVSIDGVNNLITGTMNTAFTGRRMSFGSAGALGQITFTAPTGETGFVRGFTESGGLEAIQLGLTVSGGTSLWNRINFNSNEWTSLRSLIIENIFQTRYSIYSTTNRGGVGAVTQERMIMDATTNTLNHPSFGSFKVTERLDPTNTDLKLDIGASGTISYHNVGQSFRIWEAQVGGSLVSRWHLSQTDVTYGWPSTTGRFVVRPANSTVSGRLQLVNDAGYGAVFRFNSSGSASQRVELTDVTESGYAAIWASAFTVSSSRTQKTGFRKLAPGALDTLRALEVQEFRRKPSRDVEGNEGAEPRLEIGLVAEDAPESIRVEGGDMGPAIDVMSTLGVVIASVQELAAEVAKLKAL